MIIGTFGIEKESLAELLHEAEHGKAAHGQLQEFFAALQAARLGRSSR
jgi:hypothetical protein